ncbi:MAG: inositol monophosphatase [Ignavibacteriales bacterium]
MIFMNPGIIFIKYPLILSIMFEKLLEITSIASDFVRERALTPFEIEFKTGEMNLVTEADKGSEKLIIDYIHKHFPGHGILAEESGGEMQNAEYLWVIDPLDGTTNFAHGLPIYSVSIGVMKNGETIMGAVADVPRGVIYSAEKGNGAYSGNNKITVSNNKRLEESLLVTGFPYDVREHTEPILNVLGSFLKTARGIRRLGSAAIDFCYIAQGVFDGYWEMHLNPWDICAGQLIVEEAGGKVTDFSGKRLSIHSREILCSNGLIHPMMQNIISESLGRTV